MECGVTYFMEHSFHNKLLVIKCVRSMCWAKPQKDLLAAVDVCRFTIKARATRVGSYLLSPVQ